MPATDRRRDAEQILEELPPTTRYGPHIRPSPTWCPGRYCFNWVADTDEILTDGSKLRMHGDVRSEDCMDGSCGIPDEFVDCAGGDCTRSDTDNGAKDLYDDHCVELANVGLPWFYLYPPGSLSSPEANAKLERDSQGWWDDDAVQEEHPTHDDEEGLPES